MNILVEAINIDALSSVENSDYGNYLVKFE